MSLRCGHAVRLLSSAGRAPVRHELAHCWGIWRTAGPFSMGRASLYNARSRCDVAICCNIAASFVQTETLHGTATCWVKAQLPWCSHTCKRKSIESACYSRTPCKQLIMRFGSLYCHWHAAQTTCSACAWLCKIHTQGACATLNAAMHGGGGGRALYGGDDRRDELQEEHQVAAQSTLEACSKSRTHAKPPHSVLQANHGRTLLPNTSCGASIEQPRPTSFPPHHFRKLGGGLQAAGLLCEIHARLHGQTVSCG